MPASLAMSPNFAVRCALLIKHFGDAALSMMLRFLSHI